MQCTNRILGALAFAMSVACGSSGDSEDQVGPCAQRSGTYRFNYTERSGTCGAIPEQIATIDAQPATPPPPCISGEIRYSADNCEVTNIDVLCPEDGIAPGATSTTNGKYTWAQDGSSGTGQLNLVIKDSSSLVLCQSSYNVAATRL
jgi:hypothetical protein